MLTPGPAPADAAFVVEGVDKGWTALSLVGVGCLAVAIAAELVAIRQHHAS